jgi:hypothetical protein
MAINKIEREMLFAAGIQQENVISHLQCQYCFAKTKRTSLSEWEHKDLENLPLLYDLLPQRF